MKVVLRCNPLHQVPPTHPCSPPRDGWGTSVLMLAQEQGDPRRMFIGGVGALYRVMKYSGQWSDGVRQVRWVTHITTTPRNSRAYRVIELLNNIDETPDSRNGS